jgi:hypothetical protein
MNGDTEYRLTELAELTPGQTLCTASGRRLDHSSWNTSMWRWRMGQTRQQTVLYVRNLLDRALERHLNCPTERSYSEITAALLGVSVLLGTYSGDTSIIESLNSSINHYRRALGTAPPLISNIRPSATTTPPETITSSKPIEINGPYSYHARFSRALRSISDDTAASVARAADDVVGRVENQSR